MSSSPGIITNLSINALGAAARETGSLINTVTSNITQRLAADSAAGASRAIADKLRTITSEQPTLNFPTTDETIRYKFKIELADYSRAGLFEIGKLNIYRRINLPLPLQMIDPHQVQYEEGKPLIQTPENSVIGSAALGAAKAIAGFTTNELMVVLLKGPTFKQFELTWKLAPKNADDSDFLREIIRVLNEAMAPRMEYAGAIFKFPSIFQLSFTPNHHQLYRFKPAVLKSFVANYSSGGQPAFYKATDAPESVELRMTFLELEYWLSTDYSETAIYNPYGGRAQVTGSLAGAAENAVSNLLRPVTDRARELIAPYLGPQQVTGPTGDTQAGLPPAQTGDTQ
jgi:hypothetical protein